MSELPSKADFAGTLTYNLGFLDIGENLDVAGQLVADVASQAKIVHQLVDGIGPCNGRSLAAATAFCSSKEWVSYDYDTELLKRVPDVAQYAHRRTLLVVDHLTLPRQLTDAVGRIRHHGGTVGEVVVLVADPQDEAAFTGTARCLGLVARSLFTINDNTGVIEPTPGLGFLSEGFSK